MKPFGKLAMIAAFTALTVGAQAASAQEAQRGALSPENPINRDPSITTTFVYLGNGSPAVLYEPANPGPKAQIAVFAMHSARSGHWSKPTEVCSIGGPLCARRW